MIPSFNSIISEDAKSVPILKSFNSEAPLSKLNPREKTSLEQSSKYDALKLKANTFLTKYLRPAAGVALIGGAATGALLLLPLMLSGTIIMTTLGFGAGKLAEKLGINDKNENAVRIGVITGSSIGSLGCLALGLIGLKMLKPESHLLKTAEDASLKALNATPNSRFEAPLLAERLMLKYKDPEKILAALNALTESDGRFNGKDPIFSVDKTKMDEIKKIIEERIEKNDQHSNKTTNAKLQKNIAADLIGMVKRKPTTVSSFIANNATTMQMKQTHGHIVDNKFVPGCAVSAELPNKEKVLEIPNHAVIEMGDVVILSRSGRTDTPQKIYDKSTADIERRLSSVSKSGLTKLSDEPETYSYVRSDTTFMDSNILKSIATSTLSSFKSFKNKLNGKPAIPIESERKFVENKRNAAAKKWSEPGTKFDEKEGRRYIDRQMENLGRPVTVREYEPLIFNFVFSSQAANSANVKRARIENIPSAIFLFKKIIDQTDDPNIKETYSKLINSLNQSQDPKQLKELAKLLEADLAYEFDDPSFKTSFEALFVTLTGKDSNGKNYDNKLGSDEQYILFNHLADRAGSPISLECKSGNDRTGTSTAIRCALKEFEHGNSGRCQQEG